jgi:phospholipid/cholesterol/gamma-HCH transport system substrate-binding protein
MKTRTQKFRLGIFITISSLILIGLVVFFTAQQFFEKSDTYYVSYQDVSVSGLEVGSPVKYLGIKVGSISDIKIDPKDVNSIIVELKLDPTTPVKEDTKANIVARGITGLKTIEIRGGSNKAKPLDEGKFIEPGSSVTAEITGKAEVIAEKAERVINNLQEFSSPDNMKKFTQAAEEISSFVQRAELTMARVDTLVMENRDTLNSTIIEAHRVTQRIDKSLAEVERLVQNDTIHRILANTEEFSNTLKQSNLKGLISDFSELIRQTQVLLNNADSDINQGTEDLKRNLELLKYTLENLNEASRKINSNPSILLRNPRKKDVPDSELKD